jgi:putative ABC transport system substrate-binding protein
MNISRRRFLALVCADVATPRGVAAQHRAGSPVVGFLVAGIVRQSPHYNGLRQGLRDLGYVEGQTIEVHIKSAEGKPDRLPALASELVAERPNVIVAVSPPAVDAAKSATRTIPIVMLGVSTPVELGFVASLSKPGGNVTGLTILGEGLGAKRLQFLTEVVPGLSRVAVLWNPSNRGAVLTFRETERAAKSIRITIISAPVTKAEDIPSALRAALSGRPGALNVISDPVTVGQRATIIDFATRHGLCGISSFPEEAADGMLIAYGVNLTQHFRQGALVVDKILRGANPADLPVEEPTKFELVLNLRTAKALGLAIPRSLLAQADRVIE